MLRALSDEIAVNLKDRLREVRYMIRRSRHDSLRNESAASERGEPVSPEILLGHAASVMDRAFSVAEEISLSLVSTNPHAHHGAPKARSLAVYFNGDDGARAFRHDIYYLVKDALRRKHLQNVLIHETAIATAQSRITRRHDRLVKEAIAAETTDGRITVTAKAITAMFLELMETKPIRFVAATGSDDMQALRGIEIVSLAAACLACGLATAKAADLEDTDPLESAMLALEARQDRLSQAAGESDHAALETLFQTLIAHLP